MWLCEVAAKTVNGDLGRFHIEAMGAGEQRVVNPRRKGIIFYSCLLYSVVTILMRAGGS